MQANAPIQKTNKTVGQPSNPQLEIVGVIQLKLSDIQLVTSIS